MIEQRILENSGESPEPRTRKGRRLTPDGVPCSGAAQLCVEDAVRVIVTKGISPFHLLSPRGGCWISTEVCAQLQLPGIPVSRLEWGKNLEILNFSKWHLKTIKTLNFRMSNTPFTPTGPISQGLHWPPLSRAVTWMNLSARLSQHQLCVTHV